MRGFRASQGSRDDGRPISPQSESMPRMTGLRRPGGVGPAAGTGLSTRQRSPRFRPWRYPASRISGTWIAGRLWGEPVRQVGVGERAALGADTLRDRCQQASEPNRGEDQTFGSDHSGGDRCTVIGLPSEACREHVHHAGFDREPRKRVHELHCCKRCPPQCIGRRPPPPSSRTWMLPSSRWNIDFIHGARAAWPA